ncbi:hypothetical protein LSH36_350g03002 [Paralvinella palmiformis]|uniref:Uncharacterized protein n=1 Tax=Paralvinella palmiformis TaxID=53620 RepID=A0AAD9JEN5_9ANNE|nr:hypothetical protein LSH36_350g03002 [Paralvinella palmiformis]
MDIPSAVPDCSRDPNEPAYRNGIVDLLGRTSGLYNSNSCSNRIGAKPIYQSCSDLSYCDGKKKKKARRKLSFAGFLPFLFSDKSHLARSNSKLSKRRESPPLPAHGRDLLRNKVSPSSGSLSSSTDSDGGGGGGGDGRGSHYQNGIVDGGSSELGSAGISYRDTAVCRERMANKRHSVTFGCLGELAGMHHVESLKSILEKADWLTSQEKLANQILDESNAFLTKAVVQRTVKAYR